MRAAAFFFVILLFTVGAGAADGPYVLGDGAGWQGVTVEEAAGVPRKRALPLAAGASITVKAVGNLPAFQVKLRGPATPAPDEIRTSGKAPLFVVADTHGEYEILVAMLQKHGVVNAQLGWTFGRGDLVVLGDVFDRGPNHTEILWLLYQLEAEARRAGGGVHLVLGNHETMVLLGDLRYLNPKYVQTAQLLGVGSYSELFGATSVLGQWLRTKPTMLKINDLLCLHAGISRALIDSGLSLREINAGVRSLLDGSMPTNDAQRERAALLMGSTGPLWYRGYFAEQTTFPTATMADVDLALEKFGAHRILIGHTIVPTVRSLYDGKVIAVNVYPRRDDDGRANFESLLIRRDGTWRAKVDGTLEVIPGAAQPKRPP
ncbi:MAG TPA: metallophosphoesterase [Steroidobacteraceae bacterium]|nr:metallophosphoesterase [Steroidobacteraceae bacterium]